VAALSAPARSMAVAAALLVPTAHTAAPGTRALTAATSWRPRPPPWPSMTRTVILCLLGGSLKGPRPVRPAGWLLPHSIRQNRPAVNSRGLPDPAAGADKIRRRL